VHRRTQSLHANTSSASTFSGDSRPARCASRLPCRGARGWRRPRWSPSSGPSLVVWQSAYPRGPRRADSCPSSSAPTRQRTPDSPLERVRDRATQCHSRLRSCGSSWPVRAAADDGRVQEPAVRGSPARLHRARATERRVLGEPGHGQASTSSVSGRASKRSTSGNRPHRSAVAGAVGSNTESGKQKVVRSSTAPVRRRWTDPNPGAPPIRRRRWSSAPYFGRSAAGASS
jgi:hypothetical protein